MRLRNKKTGETFNAFIRESFDIDDDDGVVVCDLDAYRQLKDSLLKPHAVISGKFHSLTELNEEWEDYKPKEPLIKDEKVRKAVRAWAEAEGETQVQVTHCRSHILSIWGVTKENGNIDFDCDIEPFDEGFYTIEQLCGEEEE